jgi:hypothetical protein
MERVRSELPFVVLALILSASAQHVPLPGEWMMNGACGSVEYVDLIPVPNQPRTYTDKRKPLADLKLELYRWEQGKACCEDNRPLASTVTDKKGRFAFSRLGQGKYWVVARWNDKDYEFPANFNPTNKVNGDCANQGFQIDNEGTFQGFRKVTTD